jgi:hypothetical protein
LGARKTALPKTPPQARILRIIPLPKAPRSEWDQQLRILAAQGFGGFAIAQRPVWGRQASASPADI